MATQIVAEDIFRYNSIALLVEPTYEPTFVELGRGNLKCNSATAVVVAVDLSLVESIGKLRAVENDLRKAKKRIFVLDKISRLHAVQAYALGATKVLFRPTSLSLAEELSDTTEQVPIIGERAARAAAMGAAAIKDLFASVRQGSPIDVTAIEVAGKLISDAVREEGLSNWLRIVRGHHEGTYQHCLLVTGVAVDFGLHLGVHRLDIARLSTSAMLHDVGKAAIPISILDKPGKLDDVERAAIETHPAIGYSVLKDVADITHETLDSVLHHHEFLDGSGYPDGLCDGNISDLVRILTVSDIFSALIERRSYRAPMPRERAYDILQSMGGKLEIPLVTEFKQVALLR